ncbi:toxin-antitoxin system, toxin component, HicA family [Eggerthella sp. HGA1]|nr:toxin-antitoxin system, toxin component, HicA family [Eggerthella sp. HGA1]
MLHPSVRSATEGRGHAWLVCASCCMVSIVILFMSRLERIVGAMRQNPCNVAFSDLAYVCETYFGEPRQKGTSHRVYRTPWSGDPRINIQNDRGKAKPYQVRQVLKAIDMVSEVQ